MSGSRHSALLAATGLALGLLILPGHATSAARSSIAAPAAALYGANLIRNGNAEAAPGASGDNTVPVPDFMTISTFTTSRYNGGSGDLSPTSPGPADRGANYFYGGPDKGPPGNSSTSGTQVIDVSSGATDIDRGPVTYRLSAWLGGYANQDDNARLTATFQDGQGTALGAATIGPVLSRDRNGVSELLYRQTTGTVPRGTRQVRIVLLMTKLSGSDNDALADDLALVFTAPGGGGPAPAVPDLTGLWQQPGSTCPPWHLTASGAGHNTLHASWRGCATHASLVGSFQGALSQQNGAYVYTGTYGVSEGSGSATGTMSFRIVSQNEFLLSYQQSNGPRATNLVFTRVSPEPAVPDLTGLWQQPGSTCPPWHLTASGAGHNTLHASWRGCATHASLVGSFQGALSQQNGAYVYTGTYGVSEGSGSATGTMSFRIVSQNEFLLSYQQSNGPRATNLIFRRLG